MNDSRIETEVHSTRNESEEQGFSSTVQAAPVDRLAEIVSVKRLEVEALRPAAAELRALAADAPPPRSLKEALRHPGEVRLLAEIKRRSPSAGAIRPGADAGEIAAAYEAGGAAALSVLTDRQFFDGSLDSLGRARSRASIPLLRKDFLIDPVQVYEARAGGADAVLLIVRILARAELADLNGLAQELGLEVLVEVHDEEELALALDLGFDLVGVNSRDLRTFRTDLAVVERLAALAPSEVTLVAESGIHLPADVLRMGAAGVHAVLVGESLMRQPDVAAAAAVLTGHPRVNRAQAST